MSRRPRNFDPRLVDRIQELEALQVVSLLMVLAMLILALANAVLWGHQTWLYLLAIGIGLTGALHSMSSYRCPACDHHIGFMIGHKRCKHCGERFTRDDEPPVAVAVGTRKAK